MSWYVFVADGFAPFMSLAERETLLVYDSILAAPGPGQYDPKAPQVTVKVRVIFSRPYWVVRSRLWYGVLSVCRLSVCNVLYCG